MKTNRSNLNDAFADVESLDYMIIAVITAVPLKVTDGKWRGFPKVVTNEKLKEWDDATDMILVGLRSTGSITVPFTYENGKYKCLLSEEERIRIHRDVFNPVIEKTYGSNYELSNPT